MRLKVSSAAALTVTVLVSAACTSRGQVSSSTGAGPSPTPVASEVLYAPYSGSYRTTAGETWAVSLQGLLVNLHSGLARALAPRGDHRFTVGPSVGLSEPPDGEVTFAVDATGKATELDGHGGAAGTFAAPRLSFTEREVHFDSAGVAFGATLTEPSGGTHLPAIALIHGSGIQPRPLFSLWANVYASLGFAVLNYDKRGTGESGGQYPGEFPTDSALSIYADDAVAAARFLLSLPEVDPSRVGFHGGSQGGWVVPLALQRVPELAFGILASAPATTVDETDFYQGLSGGSSFVPHLSDAEIDAQVRQMTTGYDPAPALRALHVPTLWVYGEKDRQVPVRLSIANLHLLQGKDLTVQVLPGGWHGLTETPNGLQSEETKSKRFAPGLFTVIGDWARAHQLSTVSF